MRSSTVVLLILALEIVLLAVLVYSSHSVTTADKEKTEAFLPLKILGLSDLSIATDCYSTRNPSLVDMAGCFADLPGGICYHASCPGYSAPSFYDLGAPMEVER